MSGPLAGIKVVDFTRVLAGPLCARTLLDLGADVIKIEPPRPDVARMAFPGTQGMSGYFAQQNSGKKNVSIDLNVRGARELVLMLCDQADVVVENFRAGTMKFFGLDYETLAKRNPKLIYASISGYGQTGPWMSRMAYAPAVQAETGFTANSLDHYGSALSTSRTDSLSHGDVYTGLQAAVAVLAALASRSRTGQGQHIDVPMAAALLSISERAHLDLNPADLNDEPAILGATDCPFFDGPSGERFVASASLVGSLTFPWYLRAMRRADLANNPRFATTSLRKANAVELHAIVQTWIYSFSTIEALDCQFDEAKIAMGLLRSVDEFVASEWAQHWNLVESVPDRRGGEYRLPGKPWKFSREALAPSGIPAFRGEHNEAVFSELGVSREELNQLNASGALVADHLNAHKELVLNPRES